MDKAVLILHILAVYSLTLTTLGKTYFLYTQQTNRFDRFTQRTQLAIYILLPVVLLTGGFLLYRRPEGLSLWLVVKFAVLVAAVTLLKLGEKRKQFSLMAASSVMSCYVILLANLKDPFLRLSSLASPVHASAPVATKDLQSGKQMYLSHCRGCHGLDGNAGYLGAANLRQSRLPDDKIRAILQNGQGSMPKFQDFSSEETTSLVQYLHFLRQRNAPTQ